MISPNLQKAIDALQIQDVYLRGLVAHCVEEFDPKYCADYDSIAIQTKHLVKRAAVLELENEGLFLRVSIDLGARWIDTRDSDGDKAVRALIEAEFIAEYKMTETLEQSCIDEFALKNCSYHVWPYWRELLMTQSQRMHLPRTVLPTMQLAHNRHNGAEEQSKG